MSQKKIILLQENDFLQPVLFDSSPTPNLCLNDPHGVDPP